MKRLFLLDESPTLNKLIHQTIRNRMLAFLQQLYSKVSIGFCFNAERHFITKIFKNVQWKERDLFCKTVLEFLNSYLFTFNFRGNSPKDIYIYIYIIYIYIYIYIYANIYNNIYIDIIYIYIYIMIFLKLGFTSCKIEQPL